MKLGLTMIVKNEEKVIGRCLESVFSKGIIDYYSIVDTGSTDSTISIIKDKAKKYNVEGVILSVPFKDFAYNRNVSLDAIRGICDWAFWIDADELLVYGSQNIKSLMAQGKHKYFVVSGLQEKIFLYRTNLFKIEDSTVWKGKVHEYITVSGYSEIAEISDFSMAIFPEGNSWKNERGKYLGYEKLLLEQIDLEPTEPRWYYFLADTYRNIKEYQYDEKAIEYYKKRASIDFGNEEEIYVSNLMIASLKKKLYGELDFETLAKCKYPTRIEHLLTAASFKMEQGKLEDTYALLQSAKNRFGLMPNASLIVDTKSYAFTVAYFMSVICAKTGRFEEMKENISLLQENLHWANKMESKNIEELIKLSSQRENLILEKTNLKNDKAN